MKQITLGELRKGDIFHYRENGPEHTVVDRFRGGRYIREKDVEGRISLLIHSTPVYVEEEK